jgi:oxygen-independent coproporphyrinogen-3 oxidase
MVPDIADTRPRWLWPRSAYIHIPFCAHHCGYCDFAIAVGKDAQMDLYLEALGKELSLLGTPQRVETLFLGGGTPTYLGTKQLEVLLRTIRAWLPLEAGGEFSVEANPGNLTHDKVRVLAEHGVNRISLGAQSFDAGLLQVLERDHRPEEVARALDQVRQYVPRVSLDLIFGVPGQTLEQWQQDLETAVAFAPDHLASYGLTYEKGTPLWKQRQRGQVQSLDEDTELAMYTTAMDVLEGAGYEQYEISNFARPGGRCRHNQVYWANHAYFGFGMGAARYVDQVRSLNTRDLHTYLQRTLKGESAVYQSEKLEPLDSALETVAVQLRRKEGVNRSAFVEQTGFSLDALLKGRWEHLQELGLLEDDGNAVRLTRRGKCVADAVITELL